MGLIYKNYKVFLVSDLPENIKQHFKKYNSNNEKCIALFFEIGEKTEEGIIVYGDLLTEKDYFYHIHNYFSEFSGETILIYYNE